MILVDSHCHLDQIDLSPYDGELGGALKAAEAMCVQYFLCVSIDMDNVASVISIAEKFSQVYASVGLHPNEVLQNPSRETLMHLAQHPKVIAIGETGLDYYRDKENQLLQQAQLRTHIDIAKTLKKPLIIHTREAQKDTIAILKEERADEIGGVMHCFTEDWEMAKQALDLGFYISISGIVTFKNAEQIRDVASKVPLDRLLIETDAPYLSPVPKRGKSNEPAYVRYVAEYLAELRLISLEALGQATTENFFRLFSRAQLTLSRDHKQ
jgi:TatD DNase family protein